MSLSQRPSPSSSAAGDAALLRQCFAAAFAASPIATTLIDARGTIVDINDAFMDMARKYVDEIRRQDRIGCHVLDFFPADSQGQAHRRAFAEFIDHLFATGEVAFFTWEMRDRHGHPARIRVEGHPLRDGEGRLVGAALLREDVDGESHRQRRQQALARVRQTIWEMDDSSDAGNLLMAVRDSLRELGVPFTYCGVNIFEGDEPAPRVHSYSLRVDSRQLSPAAPLGPAAAALIARLWRCGRTAYRKDLEQSDPHGERARLGSVRCVLDVPFSQGTLAVSSTRANAFSAVDIEVLEEMGQVLSEGFQRLRDLEAKERHAQNSEALARAIAAVAGSRDLDQTLQVVVEEGARLLGAGRAFLLLYDQERQALHPRAQIGYDWTYLRQVCLQPTEGAAGLALAAEGPVSVPADLGSGEGALRPAQARLLERARGGEPGGPGIALALRLARHPLGVLCACKLGRPCQSTELEMLARLAEQAAVAIDQAYKEAELQRQQALREAESSVRLHIASMNNTRDLLGVAETISHHLAAFGVEHDGISIQIAHEDGDDFISFALDLSRPESWAAPDEALDGRRWQPKTDNARRYPWVLEVWRSRRPRHVARTEATGYLDAGLALLDVPFSHGTLAINRRQGSFGPADIALLERFADTLSEGFQRFLDIAERERSALDTRINLALQRLRNEVLQMQGEEDWQRIAHLFYGELRRFVPCYRCGIALVDEERRSYVAYRLDEEGVRRLHYDSVPDSLRRALEENATVYRRRRSEFGNMGERIPAEVHSVVDVPFRGGTVSMNSTAEDPFSALDIHVLEQFALVLSEAHRRLEDLEKLRAQEAQLRQSQKMEIVGQLAGGIAHDFNNMLTAILAGGEHVLDDTPADDPRRADLELIVHAGERAAELTQQLLAFSRRQVLRPQVLDINAIVERQVNIARRLVGEHIQISAHLAAELWPVEADETQLEQILLNLIVNARDAMPQGGKLRIATANALIDESRAAEHPDASAGPHVQIEVADEGVGMSAETMEHIFEPFFTTKSREGGTGLGLSTTYGIVRQSGGHIRVSSRPGMGSTFEIFLPRSRKEGVERDERASPQAAGGRETVLLVEDEDDVRYVVQRALCAAGYQVVEAASAERALEVAAQRAPIHLLLTDVLLPGMNGRQLAGRLRQLDGGLRVIFMSGYAEDIIDARELRQERIAFLQKPFTIGKLTRLVREVLDGS